MSIIGVVALILVADDNRAIRRLVRKTLQSAGHTVSEVSDGRGAIDLLMGAARYDLLILDLNMPGVSGGDTLGLLRADLPELAVIVITGYISVDSRRANELISQRGVARLLAKPFKTQELVQAVDETLAGL